MRDHDGRSVPGCREKWPDRKIGHRSGRLERRKHRAGRPWLPGHPAVCYRPRRSRVHLGNVGLHLFRQKNTETFAAEPPFLLGVGCVFLVRMDPPSRG